MGPRRHPSTTICPSDVGRLSQNVRYNIRKRLRSGHYTTEYLARMYGITPAEIRSIAFGLTSRQLDDIRRRVNRERREGA